MMIAISKKPPTQKWQDKQNKWSEKERKGPILESESTFKLMQKKKEEIKNTLVKEIPLEQQENIRNFWKIFAFDLKNALNANTIENKYLFELIKDVIKKDKSYNGFYKANIIKKDDKGIAIEIAGGKNYRNTFRIDYPTIIYKLQDMDNKNKGKKISEDEAEKIKKDREKMKPEDIEKLIKKNKGQLVELEYGDSVIFDAQWGDKIRKVDPNDIIEETANYIKEGDDDYVKSKKIQTLLWFFNESKDHIASDYIKDFFQLLRDKNKQRKIGSKPWEKLLPEEKKAFAEKIKSYLNIQDLYLHKEHDIDKSAVKFLLKKFGLDPKKRFNEIDGKDIDKITSWLFIDVGKTEHGIKVIETVVGKNKAGKDIIKRKTIMSEHVDGSDKAMLTERPNSTTQMIYKIAKELWVIDESELPQIQRFVNFVNTVDSMDYQLSRIDYPNNYKTLLGLYRNMHMNDIFEYFKNPEHTGFETLPDRYLQKTSAIKEKYGKKEKITLKQASENQMKRIETNEKRFNTTKEEKKVLEFMGTPFIVDIDKRPEYQIMDGPQIAGYHKYGYFTIKPERWNLYIYSPKKFPPEIEWFRTDGHFLTIDFPTPEILEKLFERFELEDWDETKSSLKQDIIERLKYIREKPATPEEVTSRCQLLPELTQKDLKAGKKFSGVINFISGRLAFVTLDKDEKFRVMINADRETMKKYTVGNFTKVTRDKDTQIEAKKDRLTEKDIIVIAGSLAPTK